MNTQQLSEEINKVRSQVLRQLLWLHVELAGKAAIERRDLVALIRERLGVSRATAYDYATTLILLESERRPLVTGNDDSAQVAPRSRLEETTATAPTRTDMEASKHARRTRLRHGARGQRGSTAPARLWEDIQGNLNPNKAVTLTCDKQFMIFS